MKVLKWILIVLAVLSLLFFFVLSPYMRTQTKKHSPETTVVYTKNGMDLSVTYSSPSKKDRVIFGELVPYDAVWRTGANEPTTFSTANDIKIAGKNLPAGTYSLWTRPSRQSWSVIFNKNIPEWGVTILSGGKETTRVLEEDVVEIEIPTEQIAETVENFTIDFDQQKELYMRISWDRTRVKVPISK
ncbi:DUF2911 domain-containing protein [Zobellia amurskyensis]|uniref:DUF2911 domain-containing protein n=1 Tax=Zobellia amurskyensis TaxID=248905 RepID=A0A7X3D218_9FLAO|nr:DUF2911 domain-containing protein [Zobellia amurskyensis]MUH36631.1 DUF2911 domain-containing protein [Zobellia amurskyensis]